MYYLDLSDDGNWLIKNGTDVFHAGENKEKAENLIFRLNNSHRPNIEEINNVLYVCWNLHLKGEKCDWIAEISPTHSPLRFSNI